MMEQQAAKKDKKVKAAVEEPSAAGRPPAPLPAAASYGAPVFLFVLMSF
jgi:hypothetical protein